MAIELFKGTSQWEIGEGVDKLTITRDQQGEDAILEPMLETSDLKSLASSMAVDYIQTGAGMKATLTIADMSIKLAVLALCYNSTVITSTTKSKAIVKDLAGTKSVGRKIIIKPYDGLIPSTDANTWITIPNAKIINLDGTSLAFGLQTQQMLKINFMAVPDDDGVKFILGDETAVGT